MQVFSVNFNSQIDFRVKKSTYKASLHHDINPLELKIKSLHFLSADLPPGA